MNIQRRCPESGFIYESCSGWIGFCWHSRPLWYKPRQRRSQVTVLNMSYAIVSCNTQLSVICLWTPKDRGSRCTRIHSRIHSKLGPTPPINIHFPWGWEKEIGKGKICTLDPRSHIRFSTRVLVTSDLPVGLRKETQQGENREATVLTPVSRENKRKGVEKGVRQLESEYRDKGKLPRVSWETTNLDMMS